jgi:Tol biopolymer transport system component
MKFKAVILLSIFLMTSACSRNVTATSIPSASPVVLTPTNIETPEPTVIPSPTATLFPPLAETGPYLILRPNYDSQELYIYDANGHGRRIITLPSGGHILGSLDKILSPDGKWLAYYSGSIDDNNFPVTLNLLSIKDGTTKKVADVVMEGYEQKLEVVAGELKQLFPDFYKPTEGGKDWVSGNLINDFIGSIYSVAWSPDSNYLAFAAQIDGLSSDIYLYNMYSGSIQRVEDSLQNISEIGWSPDGNYVVFENSIPGQTYTGSNLYAMKPTNTTSVNPQSLERGFWWEQGDWLSSNLLLLYQGSDGGGISDLRSLDISTGRTTRLWEDAFFDYAIDDKNHIIAVSASEFSKPENFGLYFINFSGSKKKILDGLFEVGLAFRGGEKHRFLMAKFDSKLDIFGINADNTTTSIGNYDFQKISPDHSWLLLSDEQKIDLYDKSDELTRTFLIPNVRDSDILWRPDSQGIFYSTGKELYYLPVPDGASFLVGQCFLKDCIFSLDENDSAWRP